MHTKGQNIRRLQKHVEPKSRATKCCCLLPDTLRYIPAVEIISVVVVVVLIATEKIKEIAVLFVCNGVTRVCGFAFVRAWVSIWTHN